MAKPIFVWAAEVYGETVEQSISRNPMQCIKWFYEWLPSTPAIRDEALESVRFVRIRLGDKVVPPEER